MSVLDDEIDRLYQEPLTTFTQARDALAKRSGREAAMIRRLQKPSAAAKSGSRWWLWLFLLAGIAAYLALRTH
jgi:hypothetical protein